MLSLRKEALNQVCCPQLWVSKSYWEGGGRVFGAGGFCARFFNRLMKESRNGGGYDGGGSRCDD